MTTSLDHVASEEVGERLRVAREVAKITQAAASTTINMARTTLVAIEQGQRRIRIDELQKLAKLYGTSVNALLRKEAIHVDVVPKFRRLVTGKNGSLDAAATLLANLAKAEVELENLLGIQRVRNYPPERLLLQGDVRVQAEQDALEIRQWLGLGLGPIPDIVTLLEFDVGARVYVRGLDAQISGLFVYEDALGACILLNANHPRERRSQTAAHELGHLVSARRKPEVLYADETQHSREERYAIAFARSFLTPARAVMQKFKQVTAGATRLTRRHIIVLAHAFGVSREAIVRRLEELGLTKPGTWDWFEDNGGITEVQATKVLGDLSAQGIAEANVERPTTLRLNLLAGEVWRQGLLSEGQLARLMHLNRVELRELLDGLELDEGDLDDQPRLGEVSHLSD